MNILIADDHTIVREGLRTVLRQLPGIVTIDEVNDGIKAYEAVKKKKYDLLILDISMPFLNGLELLQRFKEDKMKINVLVLSMHPQEQYAIRALKLGASGYLTKDSVSEELIQAIRKISLGKTYVSAALADQLAEHLIHRKEKPPHEYLSEREYQVMLRLAQGKSVGEISRELFLSVKTISTYRARILEKMNMKKNAELSLYAIKEKLIE